MTELETYRAEKDAFFRSHPQSPLPLTERSTFSGLCYFPENADLRFEVRVTEFEAHDTLPVQTTTGELRHYQRHGRFQFAVNGQMAELTIYLTEHGYFLPFVDALAGIETYGAGRYVEPEPMGDGTFLVDFNLAYNPYCAYNDRYSCPLTPAENRLAVAIRAGEKNYHT